VYSFYFSIRVSASTKKGDNAGRQDAVTNFFTLIFARKKRCGKFFPIKKGIRNRSRIMRDMSFMK
jgi:hypothetical protein